MLNKEKYNSNDSNKVWFKNLQKAREDKGWTQVKLAMEAEISQQSITYYESGTRIPSLEIAQTSIDYLIGNDNYMIQKYYKLNQKDKDAVNVVIEGLSNVDNK